FRVLSWFIMLVPQTFTSLRSTGTPASPVRGPLQCVKQGGFCMSGNCRFPLRKLGTCHRFKACCIR
uniref:Beta-defensin-like domain-containing protein n=1 Tax=Varanus komodoensis TaxID=61221 RepID=A0A8D2JFS6_VARKO